MSRASTNRYIREVARLTEERNEYKICCDQAIKNRQEIEKLEALLKDAAEMWHQRNSTLIAERDLWKDKVNEWEIEAGRLRAALDRHCI
jgi:hypothetical protein